MVNLLCRLPDIVLTAYVSRANQFCGLRVDDFRAKAGDSPGFFQRICTSEYKHVQFASSFESRFDLGEGHGLLAVVYHNAFGTSIFKGFRQNICQSSARIKQIHIRRYNNQPFSVFSHTSNFGALFAIVGQWNTYMDTMLYNAEDSSLHTISYVLMQFVQNTVNLFEQTKNQSGDLERQVNTNSLKMAITTISILPIAFVYPFLQKYFVKGIMIGAIKG